ncbi:21116_t:CDS:2, partial [Racocetra persica]
AKTNIEKAQDKQKARHDQSHQIESYSIGDKVLLEQSSLLTSYSVKFKFKFTGLYYIYDVCGNAIIESFLVTTPLLKHILQVQDYLKGSTVDTLRITSTTIEFLDNQGDQVP